ncbi:MAG: patatin-like phospholipase family protein [Opitutaceae bacterium]
MKKPKVGIALGGGGVRGLAHIPALETLDTLGIRPCGVAGTSMGALIGALYAAGLSGKDIRAIVKANFSDSGDSIKESYSKKVALLKWIGGVRPSWEGSGLLKADGLIERLIDEMSAETFEDLQIPLRVVATDFFSGEPVVFDSGELLPALKASMSIPGVFVPVERDGRVLVDGGIVNNLPFDLLPDDCGITVAIDVAPTRKSTDGEAPGMVDAILGMFDIMVDRITTIRLEEKPPDIYIRPELVGIRILDFDKVSDVFEQAQPAIDELEKQLKDRLGC